MNAYKDVADQGIEPRSDTRKVSVLTNRRNGQNGSKRPKKEIILTKTKKTMSYPLLDSNQHFKNENLAS